jgi:hypothetical protein
MKMMIAFFSLGMVYAQLSFAQNPVPAREMGKDFIERVVETQTKEKNPSLARSQLTTLAMEQLSFELIKEIIGESKLARNRSVIQNRIVKNSARYIPFTRPGELKALQPEGFSSSTLLRVNMAELQKMLLEQGLFYEQDGTPMVLPFILWSESVKGKTLAWWTQEDFSDRGYLRTWAVNFEKVLSETLEENQFYMIRPQTWSSMYLLPSAFYQSSLRPQDLQAVAQHLGAQIYLQGAIGIQRVDGRDVYQIQIKISALQTLNGRTIADVVRVFSTDSGAFESVTARKLNEVAESVSEDLSKQVLEAWKRGSLGASVYRLSIRGHVPLQLQEPLKEALRTQAREIRSLRERVIAMDSLEFELDSSVTPEVLAERLKSVRVGNLKLSLQNVSESGLIMRVER